ncbi:hypothetical protein [uncultured Chryseobacterium sp.]|uniref:hypothetical protein n=1 Tax=uncultured Chryseobacterium sp. TaxID=259322 RepID=UPI0025EAE024|nr:hypothetical protein [uncultured Chryseobacterium sp.]
MKTFKHYLKSFLGNIEMLIETVKSNGIYIFLSVFFVFLLYIVSDVTNDFIYSLYEKENFFNIFLISFSFFLMLLALWVIPAGFFRIYLGYKVPESEIRMYYAGFEDLYNGKRDQIPVKYLAIAPWVIYTVTLAACLIRSLGVISFSPIWTFFILIIPFFYILYFISEKFSIINRFLQQNTHRKKIKRMFMILMLLFAAVPLLIFLYRISIFHDPFELKSETVYTGENGYTEYVDNFYNIFLFFLIIYNGVCIISAFLLILYKENEPSDTDTRYHFSRKLHFLTIILSTITLSFFCILSLQSKLIWISPVVVLTVCSTLLILLFEFIYTTPRVIMITGQHKGKNTGKYNLLKYIFYIVLLAVGLIFMIQPHKIIYLVKDPECSSKVITRNADRRYTLEQYFDLWLAKNHPTDSANGNQPVDVFLVSGQGGGSTAGSWILGSLLNVDINNRQFYKSIFSISTVSGSSSGASFYFAVKTRNLLDDEISGDSLKVGMLEKRKRLVADIYTKNYFSSNFLGLMFSDYLVNPVAGKIQNRNIDRNYILQQEEKQALIAACRISNSEERIRIENYFDQNYLDLWYSKKARQADQLNPLFFLNTTFIEEGEKAVFSPVKTDGSAIWGKDILRNFAREDKYNQYYIPVSAAVAQSQAFPMLSTYNLVPGTGYLADGGFYENTGTSTTLEVYRRLKKHVRTFYPNRNIRFIMINFISLEDQKEKKKSAMENKSMLVFTINQTYKTPFKHASDALCALQQQVQEYNDETTAAPYKDISVNIPNSGEFATTRLISTKTINKMFAYGSSGNAGAGIILNLIKKITLQKMNTASLQAKAGTKPSIIYIHYAQKQDKNIMERLSSEISTHINSMLNSGKANRDQPDYVLRSAGIENIPSFEINQIRYFHEGDRGLAERLEYILGQQGLEVKARYFNYKNVSKAIPAGQLELWISSTGNYSKIQYGLQQKK